MSYIPKHQYGLGSTSFLSANTSGEIPCHSCINQTVGRSSQTATKAKSARTLFMRKTCNRDSAPRLIRDVWSKCLLDFHSALGMLWSGATSSHAVSNRRRSPVPAPEGPLPDSRHYRRRAGRCLLRTLLPAQLPWVE